MTLTVPLVDGGTHRVPVYYSTRGLAVQRSWHNAYGFPALWGVVHVASGYLVCPLKLSSRQQARAVQQALLALAVDWTQPHSQAWWEDARPLVVPVVRAALPTED